MSIKGPVGAEGRPNKRWRLIGGILILGILVFGAVGWAADWYVDDDSLTGGDGTTSAITGAHRAFHTIGDAITAAAASGDTINVAAGTYTENVNVDKSLTLTGASSATVTVTAAAPAVSVFTVTANDVNISGFTATGATGPYVGDQHAGIYFPAHVENCNIHDNKLTGNIVGILMLDTENTTTAGNNTFTSNIASTNLASGFEMQHTYGNTFTSNTANSNGKYGFCLDSARNNIFTGNIANLNTRYGFWLKQGEGTFGSNYNTFTNNTANSNTRSGIRMTNLSGNNIFTGNTFDSNTIAGMELGGTPGDAVSNLTVNNNSFSGNATGIAIDAGAVITSVVLRYNNIVGNTSYGASNAGTGTLDAENNWWGDASGPGPVGPGTGDKVSANVDYDPWLGAGAGETKSETVTGSGTVTNTPTGGDVTINATGDHTVTTIKYESNPGGTTSFSASGNYYDVHLDSTANVNSLTVEFCPATPTTVIYYWDGTSWQCASDQTYANGCITVTITATTLPSLSDLTGLPFGSGSALTLGDINGDGYINVLDARLCLQIATGFITPTAAQKTAADVDGDGDVDLDDAELLAKYIIGMVGKLGGD